MSVQTPNKLLRMVAEEICGQNRTKPVKPVKSDKSDLKVKCLAPANIDGTYLGNILLYGKVVK